MTEPEIQIENRGRITSGRWEGQEIFIHDDRASSGGYLILIGSDDQGQQGGDVWVESQDLERAFRQMEWVVEWEDPTPSPDLP